MTIRNALLELQHAAQEAERQGINSLVPRTSTITDYRQRKEEGTKGTISGLIKQVIHHAEGSLKRTALELERVRQVKDIMPILHKLSESILDEPVSEVKVQHHEFPAEIKDELMADINEMQKCMQTGCYRSAIILCGRVLETALHRKYYEATGNDLLEKSPGIGLGNLIAKLSERGVELDPGLNNQIHLINQVRIHSVHKKRIPFKPSSPQAQAIMLYTVDVLDKLFR